MHFVQTGRLMIHDVVAPSLRTLCLRAVSETKLKTDGLPAELQQDVQNLRQNLPNIRVPNG